jgi:hypothetical protein
MPDAEQWAAAEAHALPSVIQAGCTGISLLLTYSLAALHALLTPLSLHHQPQEPELEPPTDVSPYNATFSGNYSDFNPGSNYSYYYEYEPCATAFSGASSTTPVGTVTNAPTNGTVPSATVGGLDPSTSYCVRLCMQDDTAGSGYICTAPESFGTLKAPEVISNPPYDVGAYDGSRHDAQPVMPVR